MFWPQSLSLNVMNVAEADRILNNKINCIGFEVLTAVVMKSSVLWDLMLSSLLTVQVTCIISVEE
jgi:hypothetical protein